MNAELIAVGTELLMGQIANTDGQYITNRLSSLGVNVHYHTVVGDNVGRLKEVLEIAFKRSDAVILTGGLGPTYDDMTKETVAQYFNLPLEEDAESLKLLEEAFKKRNKPLTDVCRKQALLPRGARALKNDYGTAPGVLLEINGKIAIMMPGPPREMKPMFDTHLEPYFREKTNCCVYSVVLRIFGIGESEAESRIEDLMQSENPTVAPYVKTGELTLRISAKANNEGEALKLIEPFKAKIYEAFGDMVYAEGDENSLPGAVFNMLKERNLTLALAESCTGGMISSAITDFPGSSDVFLYGAVTYSNEAKMKALGVKEETLKLHGAVSEETALEMARGVRQFIGSDIGVSATGIAGPGGGTQDKPCGLVYVGISTKDEEKAIKLNIPGQRDRVRTITVLNAYNLIRKTIK